MDACVGCGLFLHHTPTCRGCVAVYMRYYEELREDGFHTPEEAESFLRRGEDYGRLSSISVLLPNGTVWKSTETEGGVWPL